MRRAEKSYSDFAAARGLESVERREVGRVTPLLVESREPELGPVVRGRLPGGIEGMVGHLAYRRGGTYRFNLALTSVPESAAFVPRLFCTRRHRLTRDGEWDGSEVRSSKLWTESTSLTKRYEVSASPYQDQNWLRQLFSPELVDWLATAPPADFSFELAYGLLVGSIEENYPDVAGLDALCEATAHLADRIRRECEE